MNNESLAQAPLLTLKSLQAIKKSSGVLRALNHHLRRQMLDNILVAGNKMTVTDLYQGMDIEQSVCSQHLAILRKEGIIFFKRSGKFIHYSVDTERIGQIMAFAEKLNS